MVINTAEIDKIINIIIHKNFNRIPKNYYLELQDWKQILWLEAICFIKRTQTHDIPLIYHHLNQFLLNRIQDLYTKKRNINNYTSYDPNDYVFKNLKFEENYLFESLLFLKVCKLFNNNLNKAKKIIHLFLNFDLDIKELKKILVQNNEIKEKEWISFLKELKNFLKEEDKNEDFCD